MANTFKLTRDAINAKCLPTAADRTYYWCSSGSGHGIEVSKATGRKVYVVRKRHGGKLYKRSIGALGEPWKGGILTFEVAKQEAARVLAEIMAGKAPDTKINTRSGGPTLREALDLKIREMRKEGRTERSIETLESEVTRLLADWMDRPFVDLKRSVLRGMHDRLVDEGKEALARKLKAHVSTIFNTCDGASDDGLGVPNPASGWKAVRYVPSRERIEANALPSWYAKVQALNPVRRDLQFFVLFTGMRSEAARHVRWEHVNLTSKPIRVEGTEIPPRALYVAKPKGGATKAFVLPLPASVVEMLVDRRRSNRDIFGPYGGDGGWVFPSLTRAAPFEVQPLAEPKEYRFDAAGKRVAHLPGLHTLRRTYLSVATEAGVTELDRSVLANHSFGRQSVNQSYVKQAFEHLAEQQAKIEAALRARLGLDVS